MRATTLIAAALALGTAANLAAILKARADVRITNDRGGALAAYASRVQALHWSGERVILDGPCFSACTLHLNLPAGQVCATRRAVLGFHSAADAQFGWPVPETNAELLRVYPPKVRDFIARRGGLWFDLITVPARRFLPACRDRT